jgi:hypothetical protein
VQLHLDLVHLVNHVIVRDDVAFRGNDHPGAQRALHHRFLVWIPKLPRVAVKKIGGIELIIAANGDLLRRLDADHRGNDRADQSPALAIQIFQAGYIFRVDAGIRGE